MKTYFSEKEFAAFVAGISGQVKLTWLALSGDLLNDKDAAELEHLLDEFFCKREHRSFRKHAYMPPALVPPEHHPVAGTVALVILDSLSFGLVFLLSQ